MQHNRWNTVVGNYVHDNKIVKEDGSSNVFSLAWLQDWGGVLFDAASNNWGAGNAYWYPVPEGQHTRFAWGNSGPRLLSDFNATPGEENGRYLSTTEKDQVLSAANMPLAPQSR